MTTFAIAYLVVWIAVVLYIARMDIHQRLLSGKIESLCTQPDTMDNQQKSTSYEA